MRFEVGGWSSHGWLGWKARGTGGSCLDFGGVDGSATGTGSRTKLPLALVCFRGDSTRSPLAGTGLVSGLDLRDGRSRW